MSVRGISLVPGTIVVLDLDGTLCYVEDVQPTHAAVVALPEQLPDRKDTVVFTPGRVGAKKISPYSSAARTIAVENLSERNKNFIGTYEQLRKARGPNYVQRTPEEEAAMSVTKAQPVTNAGSGRRARGSVTPADRKARRAARKAAKVPCVKCGELPVHANHHLGQCEYEAPVKKSRGASTEAPEPKSGATFTLVDADISKLQADNDKFAQGNRFFRVFKALQSLPDSTGTLAQVIATVAQDSGKPMTNPEKVCRRALKALVTAGNAQSR